MVGSDRAPVSCSSAALPALTILRTVSWCSPVVSQMERCDWGVVGTCARDKTDARGVSQERAQLEELRRPLAVRSCLADQQTRQGDAADRSR